jgi:hypothetical protein
MSRPTDNLAKGNAQQTRSLGRRSSVIHVRIKQDIVTFLLRAYGFLLIATTSLIFLQGFHFMGFTLDSTFLNWLCGATIGEIGGLLVLTIRTILRN